MARHSTELPPLRMSRYQRYRTDRTRGTLRKLLVHGRQREAGEREGSRHTSHRGVESGGREGRGSEMSILLVCRPVACPIIPPYIIPPLTDVLLHKLRALPIASPKAVVGIAAFLLTALGLRQRLSFIHFCDLIKRP